jgi:hypothetical protein
MTGGPLRRLQELVAGLRLTRWRLFASDEGGESAGRPSECNQNWHYDRRPLRRLQELAAGPSGRTGACSRATKEANLPVASQSAIDARRGSVKSLRAIKNCLLGMDVGGHHSSRCQRSTRQHEAVAAVWGQTPAERSSFT